MTKTITLTRSFGSLDDREPFYCDVDDGLRLEFPAGQAIVTLSNGGTIKHYRCNGTLQVEDLFLRPGMLQATYHYYKNGTKYSIPIEPIRLEASDLHLVAMPQVDEQEARIAALEERDREKDRAIRDLEAIYAKQFADIIEAHNKLVRQVASLQDEQAL